MIPRYAVLITEEDPNGPFAMMTGQEPQKQRVGRVICSIDGGKTWMQIDARAESTASHLAELLSREAEDHALADLRASIEPTGPGNWPEDP